MNLQDLIGSAVLAGFVLLGIIGINMFMSETWIQAQADVETQQNIAQLAEILQSDLNKVGLGDTTKQPVVNADSNRIKFWGDVTNDGKAEIVTYYRGLPSQLSNTPNPRDFMLYRVVAPSETVKVARGLTQFNLTYVDSAGGSTNDSTKVRGIQVAMRVESTYPYKIIQNTPPDTLYSVVYWNQLFYPRNLIR